MAKRRGTFGAMESFETSVPGKITTTGHPHRRSHKQFAARATGLAACAGLAFLVGAGLLSTGAEAFPLPTPKPSVAPPPSDWWGRDFDNANRPFKSVSAYSDMQSEWLQATQPVERNLRVAKGETLLGVMLRAGADMGEAHAAIETLREGFDPRTLRRGQQVQVTFAPPSWNEDEGDLVEVWLQPTVERQVWAGRPDEEAEFKLHEIVHVLTPVTHVATGTVDSSLYAAAKDAGLPIPLLYKMAAGFGYDVDFQRDLQPGDGFEVLYEMMVNEEGEELRYGAVKAAWLTLSGQTLEIHDFSPKDGARDFFRPDGQSVKKALMRTPINGARLSSRFGARRHPVLGYTRMHRGIDFAAPSGTPIMAAGNGKIVFRGRKGGYGNYIKIRHNGDFATAYAHMSRFAAGIKSGSYVKQGQVIGYVGSTGMSTGPHLHYEVHKAGRQINPLSVKLPISQKLKGDALAALQAQVAANRAELERLKLQSSQIASR